MISTSTGLVETLQLSPMESLGSSMGLMHHCFSGPGSEHPEGKRFILLNFVSLVSSTMYDTYVLKNASQFYGIEKALGWKVIYSKYILNLQD